MAANYNPYCMIPAALTIAGSDPSGGAGIQADLETFTRLDVNGMAVIAALTAQSHRKVYGLFHVPASFVALQLDAVLPEVGSGAVKTGMLGNAETVSIVAEKLGKHGVERLVVDPVMVSSSGTRLLEKDAVNVLRERLIPLAALLTPNLAEAEELTGLTVQDVDGMSRAARRLHELGARAVLVKGGHLRGDSIDVFYDGAALIRLEGPRIPTAGVRGTGCRLSAAIAAHITKGASLLDAVRLGKGFITAVIARSEGRT